MSDLSLISSIVIRPAYGKCHVSEACILDDWNNGKDFLIDSITPITKTGRYINRFDVINYSPKAEVIYVHGSFILVLREGGNDNVY